MIDGKYLARARERLADRRERGAALRTEREIPPTRAFPPLPETPTSSTWICW